MTEPLRPSQRTTADWVERLELPTHEDRREAAFVLGRRRDRRATLPLLAALDRAEAERDDALTQIICRSLGQLGDARALDRLIDIALDNASFSPRGAVEALGLIGRPEAVPALVRALGNYRVRLTASVALGRLGNPDMGFGHLYRSRKPGASWGLIKPLVRGRPAGALLFFRHSDWDANEPMEPGTLLCFYVIHTTDPKTGRKRTRAVRVRPAERQGPPRATGRPSEQVEGTVRWFDPARGFGFVRSDDGDEIFLHHRDLRLGQRHRVVHAGQRVRYRRLDTDRGPRAVGVRLAGTVPP